MDTIAVIGLGNIACRHRRNLKFLFPESKIIAMPASGRIPQENVNDCDEIVLTIEKIIEAKVSFAIVASPATFHAGHTIALINNGIPTLIEKPITASNEDAMLIMDAVSKNTVPVAVAYCLRYLPSMKVIKQLLKDQKIGQLYNAYIEIGQYLPDWRPTKDYRNSVSASESLGGGALLELSHELDYTQEILGPLSLEHAILRSSKELDLDVEDSADIVLSSSQNAIVNIHLDFLQKRVHRKCRFVGSLGSLEWDLIKNEIVFLSANNQSIIYSEPSWDKNQMYLEMVNDFVLRINKKQNQCVTIDSAAQTVFLVNQIKKFQKV